MCIDIDVNPLGTDRDPEKRKKVDLAVFEDSKGSKLFSSAHLLHSGENSRNE